MRKYFLVCYCCQAWWRRYTRAGRGAGPCSQPRCTAPCRGSRPPPAGPGSPLTTQTPCVFINIFTWLDWIYLENLLLIITLLKMFFFFPLCLFYLFYTYKNLYNNIVKNVFLLPSFTYSILIGDQQRLARSKRWHTILSFLFFSHFLFCKFDSVLKLQEWQLAIIIRVSLL